MKKNLSQLTMHNAQLTIKRKRSPLSIVNYPLSIAIAALLLLLAACDKEEPGPGAQSAPVVITATSSWLNDDGTRAVKESFAAGDEITLTYDGKNYVYKLDKVNGWVPKTAADALRIPLTANEPAATATCKDAKNYMLSASGKFYVTANAAGEKAWGISLAFAYPDNVGAVDLTLLKDTDLMELTGWKNVTITIGNTPKTFTAAQTVGGIVLPASSVISKIEVDIDDDTSTYEYEADFRILSDDYYKVVAGKRHALTVVVKPVTP